MAYLAQAALAADPDFRLRVKIAMLNYATVVAGESSGTTGHAKRYEQAVVVVREPEPYVAGMSLLICAFNSALTSGSTDQNISDSVAAVWNLFAGA